MRRDARSRRDRETLAPTACQGNTWASRDAGCRVQEAELSALAVRELRDRHAVRTRAGRTRFFGRARTIEPSRASCYGHSSSCTEQPHRAAAPEHPIAVIPSKAVGRVEEVAGIVNLSPCKAVSSPTSRHARPRHGSTRWRAPRLAIRHLHHTPSLRRRRPMSLSSVGRRMSTRRLNSVDHSCAAMTNGHIAHAVVRRRAAPRTAATWRLVSSGQSPNCHIIGALIDFAASRLRLRQRRSEERWDDRQQRIGRYRPSADVPASRRRSSAWFAPGLARAILTQRRWTSTPHPGAPDADWSDGFRTTP
jgi:hypothetical protein